MKKLLLIAISIIALTSTSPADDLYRVTVESASDARLLQSTGAKPVAVLSGGYLVLADFEASASIRNLPLRAKLVAGEITIDQLALDHRQDRENVKIYPLLFEENNLRLFRVDQIQLARGAMASDLGPLSADRIKIEYRPPNALYENADWSTVDLDSLIGLVSQDSVESYLYRLEAFFRRLTGTDSCYAASYWIRDKFTSFGYDSVYIDPFTGSQLWDRIPVASQNVVCTKVGTRYPDRQIIVGGHFDAVPDCPGADDNGTGTTGTLEIARILADIETEMTFVFIAFDSEESWMWGSYHYADNAAARGDDIVYMMNLDMIGHYLNNTQADLYYGPEMAYSELWKTLSDSLAGITADLSGQTASDHLPFIDNGYDVTFVQEKIFSNHYHLPSDSTTYINFDYMTRMIKGSLATVYVINRSLPSVHITSLRDAGNGHSMLIEWAPLDPAQVDHYALHYNTVPPTSEHVIDISKDSSRFFAEGLTTGQEYSFYLLAVDAEGRTSIVHDEVTGTPNIVPARPDGFTALPLRNAIRLTWQANNTELDFAHYTIIRDGAALPDAITDFTHVDDDFSLGSGFHSYLVVATDIYGNISDTVGVEAVLMRAAALEPGRILAVNRSAKQSTLIVDEVRTGEFMRDALTGYDYDYYSDTAHGSTGSINLIDMLDYELVVFGAESGRSDDLGADPVFGGILDSIGYYMSIGGKVIIFGRWSELHISGPSIVNVYYQPGQPDYGYTEYFDIEYRTQLLSDFTTTTIYSEMVGAMSMVPEYPDLTWDSLAAVAHSSPWTEVSGIPCPSLSNLIEENVEPLYVFESSQGPPSPFHGLCCLGWQDVSVDSQYVFFEIPLSFMERSSANAALQAAVAYLISDGPGAYATVIDPDTIDIPAGPPAEVMIYLGEFRSGKTAGDVDGSTIQVNGDLPPLSTAVLPSHPDFTGDVLEISVDGDDFAASYEAINDTTGTLYALSWQFSGDPAGNLNHGPVTIIPFLVAAGDANGDDAVNVGDAVYVINYVFKYGPEPSPMYTGDANGDCAVNVGDAVYLINYIFKYGPPPFISGECEW